MARGTILIMSDDINVSPFLTRLTSVLVFPHNSHGVST